MDAEQIKAMSLVAKTLSGQAIELIEKGQYVEGHHLMRQAVEAGRKCRQLIQQPKIEQALTQFEQVN